jgi:hypothetical protein
MSYRSLTSIGLAAAMTAFVSEAWVPAAGQGPAPEKDSRTLPRTADGQPDLQGIWNFATITPFERPTKLQGQQFLTPQQEADAVEERRVQDTEYNRPRGEGDTATYDQFWIDRGTTVVSTKRTSLIVDPPDGRFPPLTPEASARRASKEAARRGRGPADSWEDRNVGERCLVAFNTGYPMIPRLYNNYVQIFQSPGHVVIHPEQIHDARIVPLDGRPHIPSNIRQWMGDSRGRWEGDTLVVDTTNFTDKLAIGFTVEPSIRGFNAEPSEAFHLIERFTRLDANTLLYQFTVDDPRIWTKPFTVELPMTRASQIFEYARHEGNQSMAGILGGARADEKAGAADAKKGSK